MWGNVGMIPLFFNLSTGYNLPVSFTLQLIYLQGKKRWEGGLSPRQLGSFGLEEKSTLLGIVFLE